MHANVSGAGSSAPPLRFLLPVPILARRLLLRAVPLWIGMRTAAVVVRNYLISLGIAPPPPGFSLGWQGGALLVVAATAAVLIAERRRGVPPLLLANLGTPPAAAACWIAATLPALEAGASCLL